MHRKRLRAKLRHVLQNADVVKICRKISFQFWVAQNHDQVLWIAPQRSAAYEPLEVVTNVRKVVVIYMPETHKDLLDSLRRRLQRDAQETIATKDLCHSQLWQSSGIQRD